MTHGISITGAVLVFPSIYSPRTDDTFGGTYGLGFHTDDKKTLEFLKGLGIKSKLAEGNREVFNSKTKFPPLVSERFKDYGRLKEAFDMADVRNVPRDRLLINAMASIVVAPFDYNWRGQEGVGLGIISVELDAQELLTKITTME